MEDRTTEGAVIVAAVLALGIVVLVAKKKSSDTPKLPPSGGACTAPDYKCIDGVLYGCNMDGEWVEMIDGEWQCSKGIPCSSGYALDSNNILYECNAELGIYLPAWDGPDTVEVDGVSYVKSAKIGAYWLYRLASEPPPTSSVETVCPCAAPSTICIVPHPAGLWVIEDIVEVDWAPLSESEIADFLAYSAAIKAEVSGLTTRTFPAWLAENPSFMGRTTPSSLEAINALYDDRAEVILHDWSDTMMSMYGFGMRPKDESEYSCGSTCYRYWILRSWAQLLDSITIKDAAGISTPWTGVIYEHFERPDGGILTMLDIERQGLTFRLPTPSISSPESLVWATVGEEIPPMSYPFNCTGRRWARTDLLT